MHQPSNLALVCGNMASERALAAAAAIATGLDGQTMDASANS